MEGVTEAATRARALQPRMAAIPLAVVALDQLTKAWVRAELTLNTPVSVIGDNVRWMHIRNEGAAFGLSIGRFSSLFFLILASLASALVLYLLTGTPRAERLQRLSLGLILGGAIGNIIDRLWLNGVVDFIQVGVAGYYWPIFNVADSAVTIGAVLLAITHLRKREPA